MPQTSLIRFTSPFSTLPEAFLRLEMFASYFSSMIVDATDRIRGRKGTGLIYRDELSKKMPSKKGYDCLASNNEKKSLEKRGFAASSAVEEKGAIRIKVLMTKEEASRLLSKCREGGVLEFKDVAHELAQIPVNRVSVISSAGGYGGVLHSIPEES
ncbi:hypothetical protein OIU77_022890 [Salix suchowensis]|uniref:DUF7890 domain-containing protein n=1 Tax=Salix suchowensis TaxID=1278906 RepID=A0ABQ9C3Y0_9ROSI|nr:hypothetical protein OIU77_022890 [Salix suchowensis]